MAYTDIDRPDLYFNTKLYTGTVSSQSITGVGFQPDWVWIKYRSDIANHHLYDSVRGVQKRLNSNTTNTEATSINNLTSFDSDGFTIGTDNDINESGQTYASWNWLASNTTASNTDGSITSTVSANTTSGFSIAKYTGTGANTSFGHGLGTTPAVYIIKRLTGANGTWLMYHQNLGIGYHLGLNNTTAQNANDATFANNTAPDTSKIYLGSWGDLNANGSDFICYSFAEKKGFSKFGSYVGNGSTDGPFIYTGFRPAFVIRKRTDSADSWQMHDNKRDTFNVTYHRLLADDSGSEYTSTSNQLDFLSNGFKCRASNAGANASGGTYIYMCFAENSFVTSTGIPTCAR